MRDDITPNPSQPPMSGTHVCGADKPGTHARGVHACVSHASGAPVSKSIQPIDVIERWALCHHLGCVVTYLEQAGRKNPLSRQTSLQQERLPHTRLEQAHLEQTSLAQMRLENLRKAEWYLARELESPRQCPFIPMGAQPFTTEAVLDDWDLSFHSSEALFHIKASKSPSMKKESLVHALKHLKAEIASLEQQAIKTEIVTVPQ